MLRNTLIALIAVTAGSTITSQATAQDAPTIPAGYTPYQLVGQGINAPPMPFKIEGDKIVTPEGPGTFNDDVLYIGYYQGGIRVVDVSGELRGDLYAQGREIAYFLPSAGPEDAKLPFAPSVWGVFPMFGDGWSPVGDMLYATDYNSGLWTFTVELPEKPIS